MVTTILSLGSNQCGAWGQPDQCLSRALNELHQSALRDSCVTEVYLTRPDSPIRQEIFSNLIAYGFTDASLISLFRTTKQLEWRAGRRPGMRWGARPLDIDIIDYGGRVIGWPQDPRCWRRVTLPHARAHKRKFVLEPLCDVYPDWRHPIYQLTARQLLSRLSGSLSGPTRMVALTRQTCHAQRTR